MFKKFLNNSFFLEKNKAEYLKTRNVLDGIGSKDKKLKSPNAHPKSPFLKEESELEVACSLAQIWGKESNRQF